MLETMDPSMFLTLVMLASYTAAILVLRYLFERGLRKLAVKQKVGELGIAFALRSLNSVMFIAYVLLVLGVFGLDFSDVEVLLSSVFAVVGVAFFAQWSILSNITASSIIFFSFPYRVGGWVQVIEKVIDVIGLIEDISLFHVLIRNATVHTAAADWPSLTRLVAHVRAQCSPDGREWLGDLEGRPVHVDADPRCRGQMAGFGEQSVRDVDHRGGAGVSGGLPGVVRRLRASVGLDQDPRRAEPTPQHRQPALEAAWPATSLRHALLAVHTTAGACGSPAASSASTLA